MKASKVGAHFCFHKYIYICIQNPGCLPMGTTFDKLHLVDVQGFVLMETKQ